MQQATDARPPGLVLPLAGRVALVTGASRNIGRAIALSFARAGADVIVNARASRDQAEQVAAEARALGVRALARLADVRDAAAVAQTVAEARAQLGPIDVLVNCAAVRREGPFETITLEDWHEAL